MAGIWDQLVDCICRPPRDVYSPRELLGGNNQTFMVGNMEATRLDFELTNKQGLKMVCSHYLPLDAKAKDGKLPVVVYCHCNSGSRRDAEEAIWHLLPCGVGVVAFDFTGSGLSEGKWVTLGAREVDDLGVVIKHLRDQGGVSSIGLWGRSMGAVTALLYSALDPEIAGVVVDSPFSRLTDLMLEIVVSQKLPIPKVMLRLALKLMRASVKRKAGFDINLVAPLDVVGVSLIPAMFGHGEDDSFIDIQHSVKIHEAYNSAAPNTVYKNLVRFKGDHNHPRPAFFYSSVCCFFYQQLHLDQVLLTAGNPADTQQLLRHGSLNLNNEAAEQVDRANGFVNTPWSIENMSSLSDLLPEAAAMLIDDAADDAATAAGPHSAAGSSTAAAGGGGNRGRSSNMYNSSLYRSVDAMSVAAVAGTPPVPGSPVGSSSTSTTADLNSPRAAASASPDMTAFGQCSTGMHATFGNAQQQQHGSGEVVSAPAGRFEDYMHAQQQATQGSSSSRSGRKSKHKAVLTAQEMRAQLAADGFEVGSRGRLGSIPLPVGAGAPMGLRASSHQAAAASCSSSSGGRSKSATADGSSGRNNSPGSLLAAGGQHLKRLLFRGSAGSGAAAAAGSSAAAAAEDSAAQKSSRNNADAGVCTVQQPQQQKAAGLPQTVESAALRSPRRQLQQQHHHQQPLGAAALPLAPAAAAVTNLGGTWALTVDDADEDVVNDPELAAAIAASLQEQHIAATAAAGAGQYYQQKQVLSAEDAVNINGRRTPLTPEEEEEMIARAIALSLAEIQQPQQQQGSQLPLLQEQQSEHVSQLLISLSDEGSEGVRERGGSGEAGQQQQNRRLSTLLQSVEQEQLQQQQDRKRQ